ncbi:AMIN-like domain-containing (lipo)protein [Prauserella muralis]|uniref:AMIN-like domain-containing protein n=1 Tax=Prauserella muralis TaxID=588067 RepID=A0A2V4APZ6_9PSEU|nr:hypothetical protein [Prauserella muralis]PXY22657.1 hypothetical protein BAY60_22830 [Prauserella muralis]TWE28367.1 hypothetical protein FHX69_1022 [Prauserella muralis]
MRAVSALTLAVALAFTAACGDGRQGGSVTGDTTAPRATTSGGTTTAEATPTGRGPVTPTETETETRTRTEVPARPGSCAVTEDWTLRPDVRQGSSRQPVNQVRIGRHDCFDRMVFDLRGAAPTGFEVRYVPVVHAQGSGKPLPVVGGATLKVIVRSPAQGYGSDAPLLAETGERFYTKQQLAEWRTLRAIRFAGSFEGQSSYAVGVRAKLPMRAFTLLDEQRGVRQVVVDVAHTA